MVIQHNKNHYIKWFFTITLSLCAAISTSAQAASTMTIDVSEDSYIRPNNADVNYNDKGFVEIRDISNGTQARIAFLKFNVSNLGAATISSAKLKLKLKQVSSEEPMSIDVKLLNGAGSNNWQEADTSEEIKDGIRWNNAPAVDNTTLLSSQTVLSSNSNTWFEFDVSDAITSEGTYTLLLTTANTTSTQVQFYSLNNVNDSADLELTISSPSVEAGIDVSPSHIVTVAPLSGSNNKLTQQVIVTNNEEQAISISTIANASDPGFIISEDNCSSALLNPSATCTFSVAAGNGENDSPLSPLFGFINIISDSVNTPTFPIYVSQRESDQQQAIRRIPAVVTNVSVIDDLTDLAPTGTLEPGKSYTVNFSMQSYDEGNHVFAALFACADIDSGCAETAADILVWGEQSSESAIDTSDFTYITAVAQSNQYSISLTMPEYVDAGYADTDAIVIRFYHNSMLDSSLGNGSISSIVPGGQGLNLLGKLGRKVIIWQQP